MYSLTVGPSNRTVLVLACCMPFDQAHDVVVIGSGPGGEGAAMKAAKSGASTAIIEAGPQVGGGCVHWATIPSKSLRQNVSALLQFKRSPLFTKISSPLNVTFPQLLRATESVISQQVNVRTDFYIRNHVQIGQGRASFLGPHTLAVELADGSTRKVEGKKFVIATGSRPYRPSDIDFSHPRVRDSDTILKMNDTPEVLTIYGAGVVGCEYASIFRNLGVKVNLINSRERLLSFLDDEISDALSYHLRDQGVVIRHNEEHQSVTVDHEGVTLHLKSGKVIKSDYLLWAQGRTGNTQNMGLEALGIVPDARGQLQVDDYFRTSQPHIYAVGDVVGYPSLASASYDQGRFAAEHMLTGNSNLSLVEDIPTGIYTSPEISSLGRTEKELTAEGVPYEVGHSLFRSLARAQITGRTVGMLKILFHRETLHILGIHCFGDQAAEIIHIGQAIMSQKGFGNTLMYFVNTTFNYPTMAEAYRVAALNGLNRLG